MNLNGASSLLPLKQAKDKKPCEFCGQLCVVYLVPDSSCEGLYVPIAAPCKCAKSKERLEQNRLASLEQMDTEWRAKYTGGAVYGTGERFKDAKPYGVFEGYIQNFDTSTGAGLFIFGKKGTGKTYAAAAIANALKAKNHSVKWTSSIELFDAIKATFDASGVEADIMEAHTKCDLLIIDDLGKEHISRWMLSRLFRIIDRRYCDNRPFVITADLELEQLAGKWAKDGDSASGDAIVRRIKDMCIPVDMKDVTR